MVFAPSRFFRYRFGHSFSFNYQDGIEVARRSGNYTCEGTGTEEIHEVIYDTSDQGDARLMLDLKRAIQRWRKKEVWIDDRRADWRTAFNWEWSYRKRAEARAQETACFANPMTTRTMNLWGCHNPGLDFDFRSPFINKTQRERVRWLTFGHFADGSFYFDRERISRLLTRRLRPYRFCPVLSREFAREMARRLPERVNPDQDVSWQYIASDGVYWRLIGHLPRLIAGRWTELSPYDLSPDDIDFIEPDVYLEEDEAGELMLVMENEDIDFEDGVQWAARKVAWPLTIVGVHPRSIDAGKKILKGIHDSLPPGLRWSAFEA